MFCLGKSIVRHTLVAWLRSSAQVLCMGVAAPLPCLAACKLGVQHVLQPSLWACGRVFCYCEAQQSRCNEMYVRNKCRAKMRCC